MRRAFVALIAGYAAMLCAVAQSPGPESSRGEAVAAFQAMMPVLHHPRCLVCHSAGDRPRLPRVEPHSESCSDLYIDEGPAQLTSTLVTASGNDCAGIADS
jgi:hypothetical protein